MPLATQLRLAAIYRLLCGVAPCRATQQLELRLFIDNELAEKLPRQQ